MANQDDDATAGAARLPIHVLESSAGDGTAQMRLCVFCAPRERTIPLRLCEACEHRAGVSLGRDPGDRYVLCDDPNAGAHAEPHGARPATAARGGRVTTPAEQLAAGDVMTRDVLCVRTDVPVAALRAMFLERSIGIAPVVDVEGRALGIVSKTDLLRAHADDHHGSVEKTAGSVMSPVVLSLPESAPLAFVAAMMASEGVHHVPLVDTDDRVIGVLSALDVARWVARSAGYIIAPRGGPRGPG